MGRSNDIRAFLTQEETEQVEAAIQAGEKKTAAEIKVIIKRHNFDDIKRTASRLFQKYGLEQTQQRNAVLILLVTTNHEFLIYGDEGIHDKVGQDFWNDVRDTMANHFKSGEFGKGLSEGIERIAEKLIRFYPIQQNDENEISDEIEYEE